MVVAHCGGVGCDDLHTAVGRVVRTLALLAVVVADVVCVLLVKLPTHTSLKDMYTNVYRYHAVDF